MTDIRVTADHIIEDGVVWHNPAETRRIAAQCIATHAIVRNTWSKAVWVGRIQGVVGTLTVLAGAALAWLLVEGW
jgi:hypothetical protein